MKNKTEKGFNTTVLMKEFTYLVGEFGELAEAIKNPEREDLDEALVDMCIFLFAMYEILEEDSYEYIMRKMIINEAREYDVSPTGYEVRVDSKDNTSAQNFLSDLSVSDIQQRIFENKKNKGFNIDPENIEREYVCMGEEISELFIALRKDITTEVLDAMTDLMIYILGIFEMRGENGYDLITKKMALNESRVYKKTSSGEFDKVLE